MRIHSIEFKDFKLFQQRRLDFPAPFTVIIGENGIGKTTILEGIFGFLEVGFLGEMLLLVDKGSWNKSRLLRDQSWFRYSIDEFDNFEAVQEYRIFAGLEYESRRFTDSFEIERGQLPRALQANLSDAAIQSFELPSESIVLAQDLNRLVASGSASPLLPVLDYFSADRNVLKEEIRFQLTPNGSRIENGYVGLMDGIGNRVRAFGSWYKTFTEDSKDYPEKEYLRVHLECVNRAIVSAIPELESLSFLRVVDDLLLSFKRDNGQFERKLFRDLSDGFRSVISIIGLVAMRCVRLNPHLGIEATLHSPGIVLIDELDLHLHPKWQRRIVSDLKRAFPKIQFICTTHSPFIVQSLTAEEVIDLDGQIEYNPKDLALEEVTQMMGVDSSYSIQNEEDAAMAEKYLKTVRSIGESEEVYRGMPDVDEQELDELEAKMTNPAMRALLKLERLKYRG